MTSKTRSSAYAAHSVSSGRLGVLKTSSYARLHRVELSSVSCTVFYGSCLTLLVMCAEISTRWYLFLFKHFHDDVPAQSVWKYSLYIGESKARSHLSFLFFFSLGAIYWEIPLWYSEDTSDDRPMRLLFLGLGSFHASWNRRSPKGMKLQNGMGRLFINIFMASGETPYRPNALPYAGHSLAV